MPTVLVVDDSAVDRRLVGGLLEKESGWTVDYAANGKAAMSRIGQGGIDVVVTDLQMPEMDGLDLVRTIRIQYADLPVILMTGRGSEELAVEALEIGAASYVPKSHLANMLPGTVENVLEVVHEGRTYEKLVACMTLNEFAFSLRNDPDLIEPLVELVKQMISGVGLCDSIGRIRVGIALEQALLNALYRGNLEITLDDMLEARERLMQGEDADVVAQRQSQTPYCDRRIAVEARITPAEARFVICDEGPGFDISIVPDPHDPRALEREGGRGLVLMRTFMDEVTFSEKGNEVTLVKRRAAAEAE